MRPAVFLSIVGLALAARGARAEGTITLSSLPPAAAEIARAVPDRVEAAETVRGLWVSGPRLHDEPEAAPKGKGKQASKQAKPRRGSFVVIAPAPIMTSLGREPGLKLKLGMDPITSSGVCLLTSNHGISWRSTPASALLLDSDAAGGVQLDPPEIGREEGQALKLVRAERLVEEGHKATLESVDAWVDTRTGGAREVARTTTPLTRTHELAGGIVVYAARVDNKVIFLARPPRAPAAKGDPALTFDTGEGQPNRCGFTRTELTIDKPGDSAQDILGGELTVPFGDEPPAEGEARTVRVRSFRITFSAVWLTDERSPALSASFGWTGRTRQESRDP